MLSNCNLLQQTGSIFFHHNEGDDESVEESVPATNNENTPTQVTEVQGHLCKGVRG